MSGALMQREEAAAEASPDAVMMPSSLLLSNHTMSNNTEVKLFCLLSWWIL